MPSVASDASQEVQGELDRMVAVSLAPVCLVLAGLFLVYGAAHPWLIPGANRGLAGGAVALAVVYAGAGAVMRRRPVGAAWAHPTMAALAGLALLHGALVLYVTGDSQHTVYLAFLSLGAGLVALSTPWLLGVFALIFLSWTLVALLQPTVPDWPRYGFVLLASTTLAGLAHALRTNSLAHTVAARIAEERGRRRFEDLSNASHEGVILLEAGRIVDANRAAEPLFGAPVAALRGRLLEDLLESPLPDPGDALECSVARGGRQRHMRIRRAALGDRDVVLARDVTAEREAQEREREVARLQVQTDIRTRFLDRLGHELSDHLVPLLDHTESIRVGAHGSVTPRQQQALRLMEAEMRQLDWLIQELIDTAQVDTERLELVNDSVDLEDVVYGCLAAARPLYEVRDVALGVHGMSPAWVRGDSRRLEQVIKGLLDHALRHSERGKQVEVTLRTSGPDAIFEVIDARPGFEPEHAERLFQPFSQDEHEEVELGLFVARGIAQRHGGELAVMAAGPGRGARFELRIPLEGPAEHDPRPMQAGPL